MRVPNPDNGATSDGRGMTGRAGLEGGVLAALASVVIWGLVPVGTRFFVASVDPLAFNVIRFGASVLAASPLVIRARPWLWPAKDILRLALGAALAIPAYNIPVAIAARGVQAGTMGLLIATEPVFILIFGLIISRATVKANVAMGAAIAFAGVALTTCEGWTGQGRNDLVGMAMILGGCAAWGLYAVLTAPLISRHGSAGVAGGILTIGGGLLVVISVPAMGPGAWPGPLTTVELIGMGLASALLAFLLWNKAAETLPMGRLGLFLYLIPVTSLICGALFLGEQPSLASIAGGALILLGVSIGEGRARRLWRRPRPAPVERRAGEGA